MSDPDFIAVDNKHEIAVPNQYMPETLTLIPVSGRPFFPAQVQPVVVNTELWQPTLEQVAKTNHKIMGLCYVEQPDPDKADPEQFKQWGCAVKIHKLSVDEDKIQFICQGIRRFRITRWVSKKAPFVVEVEYPKSPSQDKGELRAYGMALINTIKELLPLNPLYNEELKQYLERFGPNEPSPLTDFAASLTTADGIDLQKVLETVPLLKRMEKVLLLLKQELEVAKLQSKISDQVNQKIGDDQREFFLKQQLKIIQQELGLSKDDKSSDVEMFLLRLDELIIPDAVQTRIDEEIDKLSILEVGSPEYSVTRNYLDWATSIPWGLHSTDNLDLDHGRQVLDAHHYGLDDVKNRITEFLAVGAFKGEISGSIILLVGPPGVGKTSIGRSIADALNRKFYRFSLGGMRDEAEIKGHRRTYIGALPGKFVQALKEVKVANPVIMLDEIDKIGGSYQGDPASALLEALDPEQNSEFLDHYLDLRIDLSKTLFICTANQLDTIPSPLMDRMEVIRLAGYIAEEKVAIAKHHLWPKLLKNVTAKKSQIKISDSTLKQVAEGYAREAGVRNLEKQLSRIVRKSVVKLMDKPKVPIRINNKNLQEYLGAPVFQKDTAIKGVGVITGLAWTAMGGATLAIEASLVHNNQRGLKLTGQLGEVMRESAEIAYSHICAKSQHYGLDTEQLNQAMLHLHVPEGATPKDGPSAGITMATALIALMKNKTVKQGLAMTGELTLTGQVLPVGGIKEKVIAARRVGLKTLILPMPNERDFNELPQHLRKGLKVHFAQHYDDVYNIVFKR